jgi:hypothetical protein
MGRFCIIAGTPVHKGFGILQMSSAKMEGMKFDYAHVSTDDQTLTMQLAELKNAGCKTVFQR